MPIETYEIREGQRIDMPTGDTPPGASAQADGSGTNGTGVLAATEGEASPPATESSAPQTPPSEGGEPVEEEADLPDEQATVPFVNRKIKRLNAQRLAMQRQMDAERQQHALELAQLRGQQEATQRILQGAAPDLPQTPAPPTGPPQAEHYASHEDYVLAAARYGAQQEFAARDQQTQQERQHEQQMQFQRDLMGREEQFKQAHPDFDRVVRAGLAGKVSPVLQQALMLVPDGPAVAYTLAQKPELVQRLNTLPPPLVLVELGRLSPAPQPTSPIPAVGAPTGNGTTPAPTLHAPETPLSGAGGGAPTGTFREDMSQAEYAAWRKRTSQLAAWKER